jgi:hypothetical protein
MPTVHRVPAGKEHGSAQAIGHTQRLDAKNLISRWESSGVARLAPGWQRKRRLKQRPSMAWTCDVAPSKSCHHRHAVVHVVRHSPGLELPIRLHRLDPSKNQRVLALAWYMLVPVTPARLAVGNPPAAQLAERIFAPHCCQNTASVQEVKRWTPPAQVRVRCQTAGGTHLRFSQLIGHHWLGR